MHSTSGFVYLNQLKTNVTRKYLNSVKIFLRRRSFFCVNSYLFEIRFLDSSKCIIVYSINAIVLLLKINNL